MEFSGVGLPSMSNLDLYSLDQCISLQQQGQTFGGFFCLFCFLSFLRTVPF